MRVATVEELVSLGLTTMCIHHDDPSHPEFEPHQKYPLVDTINDVPRKIRPVPVRGVYACDEGIIHILTAGAPRLFMDLGDDKYRASDEKGNFLPGRQEPNRPLYQYNKLPRVWFEEGYFEYHGIQKEDE